MSISWTQDICDGTSAVEQTQVAILITPIERVNTSKIAWYSGSYSRKEASGASTLSGLQLARGEKKFRRGEASVYTRFTPDKLIAYTKRIRFTPDKLELSLK